MTASAGSQQFTRVHNASESHAASDRFRTVSVERERYGTSVWRAAEAVVDAANVVRAKAMDILFATTDVAPFTGSSALAEVAAALPKHLKLLGASVTIVAPRLREFEAAGLFVARRLTPLSFDLAGERIDVTVYDGRLPSQVELVLLDCENAFGERDALLAAGESTAEQARRASIYGRAIAELAIVRSRQGQPVDILHLNDSSSGLAAGHLALLRDSEPALRTTRAVVSVHDPRSQGAIPREATSALGFPPALTGSATTSTEGFRALAMAVTLADAVFFPGETVLRDARDGVFGRTLADALHVRTGTTRAIEPGIDSARWSPATDVHIPAHFDPEDASGKARCKGALLAELGFALEGDAPLAVALTALDEASGADTLLAAIPAIVASTEARVAIFVTNRKADVSRFVALAETLGDSLRILKAPTEALQHRAIAGADWLLAPHREEPTATLARLAQRYGTAPIVRAVGGFADTVVDADASCETGTGFTFLDASPEALTAACQRARQGYGTIAAARLRRRMVRLDRGWDRAARLHDRIFRAFNTPA